jgi:RND family efflux transporter MFP subunit
VVLLLAAAAWWYWGRGPQVKVHVPVRGNAAEVVYATGNVEPVFWAKVAAPARKRIVDMCRCEGKIVQKGDVLARLDSVEERAVLRELEARLERLRADAERLQRLVDRNATSRVTYEEKLTQVREHEARVAAQKDRINDLVLKAPMDGVVLRRDGEVGEIVGTASADVLFWVGKPKPLRVVADVNEEDINRVRPGQSVLLRHEGNSGDPLRAEVGAITPKGDPRTKTFRVYFDLPDDTPLKVGMSVEANVIVRETHNALLVPAEAVANGAVQIVENGRLRRAPVEVGIKGTRMVEILTGLNAGQAVISPIRADLKPGQRVRAESKDQ